MLLLSDTRRKTKKKRFSLSHGQACNDGETAALSALHCLTLVLRSLLSKTLASLLEPTKISFQYGGKIPQNWRPIFIGDK
jgi:hypothetical protein